MEEKIYDRQVTKETLSQRVIDEHQIDRHFTAADLRELYVFKPDQLDDPAAPQRPIPSVPKVWSRTVMQNFATNNFDSWSLLNPQLLLCFMALNLYSSVWCWCQSDFIELF